MTIRPPHGAPERTNRPKSWQPWVLDRMLESPGRQGPGPRTPACTLWVLVAILVLVLGACLYVFWQASTDVGNGNATTDATPSPTELLVVPAETPRTPVAPTAARPNATPLTYTVANGDTLFGIALKFGVSLDDLKSTNGLTGDIIHVGDKLIIPPP